MNYKGAILPAAEALKQANLKVLALKEKEELSLINGTQVMLAMGSLALIKAKAILALADQIAALTCEGLGGNPEAFDTMILQVRGQRGQIASAKRILRALKGSYLFAPDRKRMRLQDPYSIRCAPQVHGAAQDAIDYSCAIIERELNGVTDNPLVFADAGKIISGGNFHGQPLAMAFDFAAMALSEIANVGIEDHVSMGMNSARKLKKIVENVQVVLSLEMIAAAQAIDLGPSEPLGKGIKKIHRALRTTLPMLKEDRLLHDDIEMGLKILHSLTR